MKWLLGPRRSGKSTHLIKEFIEQKGNAILYGHWQNIKELITIHYPHLKPITHKYFSCIFLNNGIKVVCALKYEIPNSRFSQKSNNYNIYIDDIDAFINDNFNGNIKMVSSTGPVCQLKPDIDNQHKLLQQIYWPEDDWQTEWKLNK